MKEAKTIFRSTASIMFLRVEDALEYLVDEELLSLEMKCLCCFTNIELKIDKAYIFGAVIHVHFRSVERIMPSIKTSLKISLQFIFIKNYSLYTSFLTTTTKKRLANDCDITKSTVQKLKKVITSYM
ncbi:hypothetical protein DMUE_0081 [Dictyocoela muelleri]|nr:hypothetical protein DMUE_0081 [Dictyocoela muelleri]